MTPDERATWERRRYEAKLRLKEIAPTRAKLEQLTLAYNKIFCREYLKYAQADEMLAMDDGRYKKLAPGGGPKRKITDYSAEELLRQMNKEQILRMQEALAMMRATTSIDTNTKEEEVKE